MAHNHILPPKTNSLIPVVALSLSIVVLALVIILLMISISDLKKDNTDLWETISSLKSENKTNLDAIGELKNLYEADKKSMQADMDEVQNQLDKKIDDLKNMKPASPAAVPNFKIDSFKLSFFNDTTYKFQSYSGTGIISADDVKDSFLYW